MKSIDEDQIIKDVLRTNGIFSDQVLFYIQINLKSSFAFYAYNYYFFRKKLCWIIYLITIFLLLNINKKRPFPLLK